MAKLSIDDLKAIREKALNRLDLKGDEFSKKVTVHMGTCGLMAGAKPIMDAYEKAVKEKGIKDLFLTTSGCAGMCSDEPMVSVQFKGQEPVKYSRLNEQKAMEIFDEHVLKGHPLKKYALSVGDETIYNRFGSSEEARKRSADRPAPDKASKEISHIMDVGFFKHQVLVALKNRGIIDPDYIDEYIARDGYQAAHKALTGMSPEQIIDAVTKSGLRGRGGAGFPTGLKWKFCHGAQGDVKYILCNGDEGDPGAFMDRSLLEADPHAVLEGMIIGGRAIGAHRGFIYVRAEYPLAIQKLNRAIAQAREYGLLGRDILGSGFDFDIELYYGAGAFVCGEETALMRSIEGKRGMPRPRPPFPAHKGLWNKPSVLNNVETFANVPQIILKGADWYANLGTEKSKGTKVFAATGTIKNVGLVCVPMGIPLRTIIFDICGGIKTRRRKFKAVQIGGPSGGCLPESLLDTPVDYDSITRTGAIMGSGGMVVMDNTSCMVDVAKFFLGFTAEESCGKCTPCREGTTELLRKLEEITQGRGREGDIEFLESLSKYITDSSLCGLGQTAPNPVLTTLRYFRDEYQAHIYDKKCPGKKCAALLEFKVVEDKCTMCGLCKKACPADAIVWEKKKKAFLDQSKCTKCLSCYSACTYDAID